MKNLIKAHKNLIKNVKDQMGFSDYAMYWLAFLEGGLTFWFLNRLFSPLYNYVHFLNIPESKMFINKFL